MSSSAKSGRRAGPLSRRSSSKASDSETKSRPNTPLEQQQKTPSKSKDNNDVVNGSDKTTEKLSTIIEKSEQVKKTATEKADNGVASKTKENTKVKENGKKDANKKDKFSHAVVKIEISQAFEEVEKDASLQKKENNKNEVTKTELVIEKNVVEEKVEEVADSSSTVTDVAEKIVDLTENNDSKQVSGVVCDLTEEKIINPEIETAVVKANDEYSDLKLAISSDDDALDTDIQLLEESSDVECNFEECSPKFSPKVNRSKTRRSQAKVLATPETPQPKKITALFSTSEVMFVSEETPTKVLRYTGKRDALPKDLDKNIAEEVKEIENGHQHQEEDDSQLKPKSQNLPEIKLVNSAMISPYRRSTRIQESMVVNYSGNSSRDYSTSSYATRASDISRNYEDSLNDSNRGNESSFGLTLRGISGRRSTRPLREMSFKNSMQKRHVIEKPKPVDYSEVADDTQLSMNVTVGSEIDEDYLVSCATPENKTATKRSRSVTPEEEIVAKHAKRPKIDEESKSRFMSYIPSPMTALRSKFSRSQINSSTPIVNRYSYKTNEVIETANVSNINSNDKVTPEVVNGDESERKWCSIM